MINVSRFIVKQPILLDLKKKNKGNNYAHLNKAFFTPSLHEQFLYQLERLNTRLMVVIKIDVVLNW